MLIISKNILALWLGVGQYTAADILLGMLSGVSKRGGAPLFNILPPHARNTYPYLGKGDSGGEVGK